ncbi:TIGR04282 family arsenosugar biosynthesis glycosyltransferase [bacterium]|nr:TIGR04282 family arsenosugar biosynthesis glycosyltransferase [bacterium]
MNAIVVFAKFPESGKVKTRLGKQIGNDAAASLYKLFMAQTFQITAQLDATCFVTVEPAYKAEQFANYVPRDCYIFPQKGQDLGRRLLHAFDFVFSQKSTKVIALGTDSPTLPAEYVTEAFQRLDYTDVVIGPAEDGGYYLIGINQPQKALFEGIKWSSDLVLKTTIERAQKIGLSYSLLPIWYDVDELDSLRRAAADDATGGIHSHLDKLGHSQKR